MRFERVEDGTADVDARVVVVLVAPVCCRDGEDLNFRAVCAIIVSDESRWEYRDGAGGDIHSKASHVDKCVHRGQQDSTGPTIYSRLGTGVFKSACIMETQLT